MLEQRNTIVDKETKNVQLTMGSLIKLLQLQ